jgi:hypothetical protein
MIESAILNVKSTSKRIAGKGTSIIIKTSKTNTGMAPCAEGLSLLMSKPKIFISYLVLVKKRM